MFNNRALSIGQNVLMDEFKIAAGDVINIGSCVMKSK